jgi:hypothetical protein
MLRAVAACFVMLSLLSGPAFAASDYPLPVAAVESSSELDRAMPKLAEQVLAGLRRY